MSRSRQHPHGIRRAVIRVLSILVLMAAGFGVYLQVRGFPPWAARSVMQAIRSPYYALQAEKISLDLPRGLVLLDARAYRKQVLGPAALEAARLEAGIDLVALIARRPCLTRLRAENAVLRPEMTQGPPASGEDRPPDAAGEPAPHEGRFRLVLRDALVQGVRIETLDAWVRTRGARWWVEELETRLARGGHAGTVRGDLAYIDETSIMQGALRMELNPRVLLPWLDAWNLPYTAGLIRRFEFGDSVPRAEAEFRRGCEAGGIFETDARIWIEDAAYRGIPCLRADADLTVRNSGRSGTVSLTPLLVVRPEGVADLRFTVDSAVQETRFQGVSSIDPQALAGLLGILTNGVFQAFSFEGPSRLTASGTVAFEDHARSNFDVTLMADEIRYGHFTGRDCSFRVLGRGLTNRVADIEADLSGGALTGEMSFFFDPVSYSNTGYSARLNLRNAQTRRFLEAVSTNDVDAYTGNLTLNLDVNGPGGANIWQTISGSGRATIRDGRVFSLPIFGGFSEIMRKTVPGLDFVLRQTDASADFEIGGGRVKSDKVLVQGDILSLTGHGVAYFDQRLDFTCRVTLMKEHTLVSKILSALTYPISKLFEFRLRGTLREPVWYPVNFSGEMLERIGLRSKREVSD